MEQYTFISLVVIAFLIFVIVQLIRALDKRKTLAGKRQYGLEFKIERLLIDMFPMITDVYFDYNWINTQDLQQVTIVTDAHERIIITQNTVKYFNAIVLDQDDHNLVEYVQRKLLGRTS